MGTAVATPWKSTAPVKCEGLIMQVGHSSTRPEEALKIAKRVVKETMKGKWIVEPLAAGTCKFEVNRAATAKPLSVAAARDLAARLESHREVASAEPAPIIPGADPDPLDPLTGEFPSHGTGTASVIMSGIGLQIQTNTNFVSGVAPKAKLIPYRVSTSVIHLSFKKVSKAIYPGVVLTELGKELIFQIAVNPELRAKIAARATMKIPKAMPSKVMGADKVFSRYASRRLKAQMKLGR